MLSVAWRLLWREAVFSLLVLLLFLCMVLVIVGALGAEIGQLGGTLGGQGRFGWLFYDSDGVAVWSQFWPAAARTLSIIAVAAVLLFVISAFLAGQVVSSRLLAGMYWAVLPLSCVPAFALPALGLPTYRSAWWPALCIALGDLNLFAVLAHCRECLIRETGQLYWRTSRLLGRPFWIDILPKGVLVSLEALHIRFPHLLGGTVAVELAYDIHGLGLLAVESVLRRPVDYRMLIWIACFGVVLVRLLAILHGLVAAVLAPATAVLTAENGLSLGFRTTVRSLLFSAAGRGVPALEPGQMPDAADWPVRLSQSSPAVQARSSEQASTCWRALAWPDAAFVAWLAIVAMFCLLVMVIVVFGRYELTEVDDPNQRPTTYHLLGTNIMGEDVLGLLAVGGRQLAVPLLAAVVAAGLIGGLVGPWAAVFAGSWLDRLLQLVVEVVESVPKIIIILATIAYIDYEHYDWKLYMTIGATFVPTVYRAARAESLRLRLSAFIESAATLGVPWRRIVAVHIVWHYVFPLVAVQSVALAGYMLLFDSILGFIGVRQYGEVLTWGNLLGIGWQEWTAYAGAGVPYNPWCFWAPLAAVFICVITSVVSADYLKKLAAIRKGA